MANDEVPSVSIGVPVAATIVGDINQERRRSKHPKSPRKRKEDDDDDSVELKQEEDESTPKSPRTRDRRKRRSDSRERSKSHDRSRSDERRSKSSGGKRSSTAGRHHSRSSERRGSNDGRRGSNDGRSSNSGGRSRSNSRERLDREAKAKARSSRRSTAVRPGAVSSSADEDPSHSKRRADRSPGRSRSPRRSTRPGGVAVGVPSSDQEAKRRARGSRRSTAVTPGVVAEKRDERISKKSRSHKDGRKSTSGGGKGKERRSQPAMVPGVVSESIRDDGTPETSREAARRRKEGRKVTASVKDADRKSKEDKKMAAAGPPSSQSTADPEIEALPFAAAVDDIEEGDETQEKGFKVEGSVVPVAPATFGASAEEQPSQPDDDKAAPPPRVPFYKKGWFWIVVLLIVVGAAVAIVFVMQSGGDTPVEPTATSSPNVTDISEVPSTSPSNAPIIASEPTDPPVDTFDPPSTEDCIRIENGLSIEGQDALDTSPFQLDFDVNINDPNLSPDAWVPAFKDGIDQVFIPALAGCSINRRLEAVNRGLLEVQSPIRYVIANADSSIDPNRDITDNCEIQAEGCNNVKISMTLFLKGVVRGFELETLIGQVIQALVDLENSGGNRQLEHKNVNEQSHHRKLLAFILRLDPEIFKSILYLGAQPTDPADQIDTTKSLVPSVEPSSKPTDAPVSGPTPPPTAAPTKLPSKEPSFMPTGQPSKRPSVAPVVQPTFAPVVGPTPPPTKAPTKFPTASPSSIPTKVPTTSPSARPSLAPVIGPSPPPSGMPTEMPSVVPSSSPSTLPSFTPSAMPTSSPTSGPTDKPSVTPTTSQAPTDRPTVLFDGSGVPVYGDWDNQASGGPDNGLYFLSVPSDWEAIFGVSLPATGLVTAEVEQYRAGFLIFQGEVTLQLGSSTGRPDSMEYGYRTTGAADGQWESGDVILPVVPRGFGEDCLDDIGCDGYCISGTCVDCRVISETSDCTGGQFCSGLNQCQTPGGWGSVCLADSWCERFCVGGFCGDCRTANAVAECSGGQYCNTSARCVAEQPAGALCSSNAMCQDFCVGGFCRECRSVGSTADCGGGQFCAPFNQCQNQFADGSACGGNDWCINLCISGFCRQCSSDSHCSSSQYCDTLIGGVGNCVNKLGSGSSCFANFQCLSGGCNFDFFGGGLRC